MRLTWKLTVASLKMYFRQREAIVWTFLLPLFIVILFSFVRFGGLGTITLSVVDESGGRAAPLVDALKEVKTLKVVTGSRDAELAELEKGERDMVLVVPADYRASQDNQLLAYTNEEKPQQTQIGTLVVQRVLDERLFERVAIQGRTLLTTRPVKSRNLTYIDYLLPGVIAMSIMQMGIFGVAFGFVSLKKRGILRRLSVTPMNSGDFIIAQVIMRVAVMILQIAVMVGVGMIFLHLHFVGNIFSLFLIGVLGSVVFLGIGFAIAGISKSEDQVAPVANLITLPMLLLSGVFFSRTNLPGILRTITDVLPLTYLADALRSVAIDGATLAQTGWELAGLIVWGVVACAAAIKMFRWE